MNKFEMGFGGAAKETSQYERIKGLQADEHGELYSAKENETPRASRFKKAMCAITAGAMLLSAAPAFAGPPQLIEKMQINETVKFKVDINYEAKKILESLGGFVDSDNRIINIGGSGKVMFDMNTKKIDITSKDKDTIIITCEDYDGKKTVITCVRKILKNVVESYNLAK